MAKIKGIELRTIKRKENGDLEKAYIFLNSQKIGRIFFDKKIDQLNFQFYSTESEVEFDNKVLEYYKENPTYGVDLETDTHSTKFRNLDLVIEFLFLKGLQENFKSLKYHGKYGLAILTSYKPNEKPFGEFLEIVFLDKWNKEVKENLFKEYPKCKYIKVYKSMSDFNIK